VKFDGEVRRKMARIIQSKFIAEVRLKLARGFVNVRA
jgi:hypothetical protein